MRGIFLYGGCVTRDSVAYLRKDYEIVDYVARQSLISSGHPPIKVDAQLTRLPSNFQQRQLRGDIGSSLFPKLRDYASSSDALIFDLVVERFGVRQVGGGYVTSSNELAKSGLSGDLNMKNASVRFASEKHLALWKECVKKLVSLLTRNGSLERTIVFETPWASETRSGARVPQFRDFTSERMNELYVPYYSHLRALGVRVERFPDEVVIADDFHKWGPAPYHYVEEAYEWMAEQVETLPPRLKPADSGAKA